MKHPNARWLAALFTIFLSFPTHSDAWMVLSFPNNNQLKSAVALSVAARHGSAASAADRCHAPSSTTAAAANVHEEEEVADSGTAAAGKRRIKPSHVLFRGLARHAAVFSLVILPGAISLSNLPVSAMDMVPTSIFYSADTSATIVASPRQRTQNMPVEQGSSNPTVTTSLGMQRPTTQWISSAVEEENTDIVTRPEPGLATQAGLAFFLTYVGVSMLAGFKELFTRIQKYIMDNNNNK